ncbi:MAG TPA: hypothetical protein VN377_04685 [Candidatus Thermoplasmatota archaeon]|nr:hypothetical protein [Candidatus Thermoplasmatota archaeon]
MAGRITGFLREYVLALSILTIIPGIVFIIMGAIFLFFNSIGEPANSLLHFIFVLGVWNDYILIAGLIIFGIGVYYLYSYITKRKYVLDELKTDKRSEILKKRSKLESTVKHLPSKYQKMLSDKEEECNIR